MCYNTNEGRHIQMEVDILIDKFTDCLVERENRWWSSGC